MALTPAEIEEVTGHRRWNPSGSSSDTTAPSPNARAFLAIAELERMGAFERPYIAIYSPPAADTSTTWPPETVEF